MMKHTRNTEPQVRAQSLTPETQVDLDQAATAKPLKVVLISGWGRSGSTIIANILGSHPKVQNLGELRYLWDRGVIENRLCGCGERTLSCPMWQSAVAENIAASDPAKARDTIGSEAKWKQLKAMLPLARSLGGYATYRREQAAALNAQTRMLQNIASRFDADVLVDASKTPTHAMTYLDDPRIDLRVLHLERDARAVTLSWKRKKIRKEGVEGELMPRYSTFKSILFWLGMNALSLRLRSMVGADKFFHTTYEAFVDNPKAYIDAVLNSVDLDPQGVQWQSSQAPFTKPSHSISGNPIRHNTGAVPVRADDAFKTQMPVWENRLIQLATSPYRLWSRLLIATKRMQSIEGLMAHKGTQASTPSADAPLLKASDA